MSRSQLQKIHRLGTDRNARRVLQELEPYLSHFREGEKVYYLNKEGRERVNCPKVFKKNLQVKHYLMRNDLFIHLGQPFSWSNETKIKVKDKVIVIADSKFEKDKVPHFVEIDYTQKMNQNRAKIEKYRKLKEYGHFKLIWLTTTEYRKKQLEKLCEGLEVQILTLRDIH